MNLKNNNISATLSAFSRLENALRSNPLTALLRSRMSRLSHTEFRYAHSSAFSLAEAMVMLVVVSIIMAVSAPLIAHKATVDNNRLVIKDNANIRTALGNNQQFIVGAGNPEANNRLVVHGNATVRANANNGNTAFQIITQDNDNPNFVINHDGTTNIRTCIPDYNRVGNNANEDGYIVTDGFFTLGGKDYYPPMSVSTKCSCSESGCTCVTTKSPIGNMIIPIPKGTQSGLNITKRTIETTCTSTNCTDSNTDTSATTTFVPCQSQSLR